MIHGFDTYRFRHLAMGMLRLVGHDFWAYLLWVLFLGGCTLLLCVSAPFPFGWQSCMAVAFLIAMILTIDVTSRVCRQRSAIEMSLLPATNQEKFGAILLTIVTYTVLLSAVTILTMQLTVLALSDGLNVDFGLSRAPMSYGAGPDLTAILLRTGVFLVGLLHIAWCVFAPRKCVPLLSAGGLAAVLYLLLRHGMLSWLGLGIVFMVLAVALYAITYHVFCRFQVKDFDHEF